jgi:carbon monoxide dehydrogenase subunit G
METQVRVTIRAPKTEVWHTITDIGNAASTISGIESVSILEKPVQGLVGLKWIETRTMFGKTATETMWITDAVEHDYYKTRAESHGAIYVTTLSLQESEGATELTMRFSGQPVTVGAKLMWLLLGFMFAGATRKALAKDLEDIKAAVEKNTGKS